MSNEPEIGKEISNEEKLAGISDTSQNTVRVEQIAKDSSGTVLELPSNVGGNSTEVLENTHNSNTGKNTEPSKDLSEKYRLIARNTSDLIAFTTFDINPVFTFVTPSYLEFLGFEAEELLGKSWLDFIHQDDRQQIRTILTRYIDAKINGILTAVIAEETQKLDFRILDKSGHWHFLQSAINIVHDELLFISKDVTEQKHAEETLHRSEEMFSKAFRLSPESITLTSLKEGRYVDVNESFLHVIGYSRDEVIGRTATELNIWVDPNDRVRFIQSLKEQGSIRNLELRMRTKSGGVGTVLMSSEIITIDGEPCALTVTKNITDRKRNEETLQENEQRMKSIIQGLSIAAFVIDSNHRVLYWNKALEQLSNIRAEEIIGTTNHWKAFYPQERPCMADILIDGGLDNIEKWYAGRYKKSSLLDESFEATDFFSNLGSDGKWLRFTATVIRNTNRDLVGIVETLEDISEHKKAEETLRESEERYRILFNEALDGICLADAETGLIIDCNQALADLVGRERAELIGQSQTILHPPYIDQAPFSPTFRQHLTSEEGQTLETQVVTRTGIIREVEIKANHLNLQGRKMLNGIFHDITERNKAEDALRRSEEKYRMVTENASDVIWTMDLNLRFTYVTPSNEKLTGYPTEKFLKLSLGELLTPESIERALKSFTAEMQLENSEEKDLSRSVTLQLNEIRADGTIFPLEVRMCLIRDTHANPIGILGITRDIIERKKTEEALKKSEEKFVKAFKSSPVAIAITRMSDGKFVEINESLVKLFGYSHAELLAGSSIGLGLWIDNDDRKHVVDELNRNGSLYDHEYRFRTNDGKVIVARYSADIIDFSGERCILSVLIDVTEKKRAEESLRESEEKYRSIVENTQDVIMLTNPDGLVSYISPACVEVLGYNPDDLVGIYLEIFYHDDIEKVHNALSSSIQGVSGSNLEYRILTKNGKAKWVSHSWSPIFTEKRELKCIVSVVRDINESKIAEQTLKEKIEELEKYKNVTVNREVKMVDLKNEINELCKQLNQKPKYPNV